MSPSVTMRVSGWAVCVCVSVCACPRAEDTVVNTPERGQQLQIRLFAISHWGLDYPAVMCTREIGKNSCLFFFL